MRILIVSPALKHTRYPAYMSSNKRDAVDWLATVCFVPRKLAKCAIDTHNADTTTHVRASDGEVISFS